MKEEDIQKGYESITEMVSHRRLCEAHKRLMQYLNDGGEWTLTGRVEQLQATYGYMLQYMRQGISDPERDKLYRRLLAETWEVADQARLLLLGRSSTRYFVSLRNKYLTPDGRPRRSLSELRARLIEAYTTADNNYPTLQQARNDLFLATWAHATWTAADATEAALLLADDEMPVADLCLTVTAVTLSLMECFDVRKVAWLFEAYLHTAVEVSSRALVGVAIAVHCHRYQWPLYPDVMARLTDLNEHHPVAHDLNQVYLQLLLSKETEKVERKLHEEIIPGMMKQMGELRKPKLGLEELAADNDFNPDWKEGLENSHVGRMIREMEQLQNEGAAICVGTFAQMKGYPFFSDLCNWVLPFDLTHPALPKTLREGGDGDLRALLSVLLGAEVMCNSDKYSICFMLTRLSDTDRSRMMSQLVPPGTDTSAMSDLIARAAGPKQPSRTVATRQYVQDLYRLLRLSPQHAELTDIFAQPIALHRLPGFHALLCQPEPLHDLADFLLRKEHYDALLEVCRVLTQIGDTTADIERKIGYCLQKLKRYEEAIEEYTTAEMFEENHVWTLRHMAACFRELGQFANAMDYYNQVLALQPDNRQVILLKGSCLMENKRYADALQCFFQVDLMDDGNPKAWRAIAWCSFLSGKDEQAERYYDKLLAHEPTANDYLNAGHVALVQGRIDIAVERYKQSIALSDRATFVARFEADRQTLASRGIANDDVPLYYDMTV